MRKALLIVLVLLCFSCERYEKQIVGAWRAYDEIEESFIFYADGVPMTRTIEFYEDGTGYGEVLLWFEDSWLCTVYIEFEYMIDPDSITLTTNFEHGLIEVFTYGYSLNKNRLELNLANLNIKDVYLRQ